MSKRFEEIITSIHGLKGHAWLNGLPDLVVQHANEWHLSELQPISGLSYNYVLGGMNVLW